MEKTFRPITKNLSEVLGFVPSPLTAPSVYLKLSLVVGCVNILKGADRSVVKFIS